MPSVMMMMLKVNPPVMMMLKVIMMALQLEIVMAMLVMCRSRTMQIVYCYLVKLFYIFSKTTFLSMLRCSCVGTLY